MTQETKAERKKRMNRERSARCRKRNRERLAAIGATKLKMLIGAGTADDIECIREVGEFKESAEGVTLAIRYMAALARRDPTAFARAINPRNPL